MEGGLTRDGEERTTHQGVVPSGLHDSSCSDTGSGMTQDREDGMEDKYGPWMLVTCKKLG